jgi:L-fuconolactonase
MFIGGAAAAAAAPLTALAQPGPLPDAPIIDTHIHLFDPHRPQGAPYVGPKGSSSNALGAFPDRYQHLLAPLGVVGAIKVEASPWIEDNLWALELCSKHEVMVGLIGNLRPEKAEFAEYLERFRKNPLFRGIRYGNLWGYDLAAQAANPDFIAGLKRLAEADLVLDTANQTIELLQAVVRISDRVPDLRIVLDHLPRLEPPADKRGAYEAVLRELGQRRNVHAKLSAVLPPRHGSAPILLADYKPRLDRLVDVFGEDRILFGSDWPNSDATTSVDRIVGLMKQYFAIKPRRVAEKYFWRNSLPVYKWIRRTPAQAALA